MVKYKILNRVHPEFNEEFANKIDLLYHGGKDILEQADVFLTPLPGENADVYNDRLQWATYYNYLASICSDYKSTLFAKELKVMPAPDDDNPDTEGDEPEEESIYTAFEKNADLQGNAFDTVLAHNLVHALRYRRGYIGIDFPNKDDKLPPELKDTELSIAQEKEYGLNRPYLYHIDYCSVRNWKVDDLNQFEWVILKNQIDNIEPLTEEVTKTISFTLWKIENDVVFYECYEKTYKQFDKISDEDEYPLISEKSGTTSFYTIPIKYLYLPDDLWIGNNIFLPLQEVFRIDSALVWAEHRSLYEIPFYQQSSDMANKTNPVGDKSNRGNKSMQDMVNKGFLVGTDKDKLSFVGPEGKVFSIINEQKKEKIDEIYRLTHCLSSSITAVNKGAGRSAASKQQDNKVKEKVLNEYGKLIRNFAKSIYECISKTLKEDVVWNVIGMDDFKVIDTDSLINEVKAYPLTKAAISSPDFLKLYQLHLATHLIDIDPITLKTIRDQINENIDGMPMDELYLDSHMPDSMKEENTQNNPNQSSNDNNIDNEQQVGETGQIQGQEGMHLQSGQHVEPQIIYDQLKEDYKDSAIKWVLSVPWIGPVEVPLSSIDFTNERNWAASEDQDHVDDFVDQISNGGTTKPIILVNQPQNDNKMILLDGHHRALAYKQIGQATMAYVGQVGTISKEMKSMHDRQNGSETSKQKSNQKK